MNIYVVTIDEIQQAISNITKDVGGNLCQSGDLHAVYSAERSDEFVAMVFFKDPSIHEKTHLRKCTFNLKFARDYSRVTVPQGNSKNWRHRPDVEYEGEKCQAESDLVDDIISTCCGDEMEKYWRSDVEEVVNRVYKNFGSAHIIQRCR